MPNNFNHLTSDWTVLLSTDMKKKEKQEVES